MAGVRQGTLTPAGRGSAWCHVCGCHSPEQQGSVLAVLSSVGAPIQFCSDIPLSIKKNPCQFIVFKIKLWIMMVWLKYQIQKEFAAMDSTLQI